MTVAIVSGHDPKTGSINRLPRQSARSSSRVSLKFAAFLFIDLYILGSFILVFLSEICNKFPIL